MTFDDKGLLSKVTGFEYEPYSERTFSPFSVHTYYTERQFASGRLIKRDSYLGPPSALIHWVKRRYYLKQSHHRPTQRVRIFAWYLPEDKQPEGTLIKDELGIYANRDYSMGNTVVFLEQNDEGHIVEKFGSNFPLQYSMDQLYPWF